MPDSISHITPLDSAVSVADTVSATDSVSVSIPDAAIIVETPRQGVEGELRPMTSSGSSWLMLTMLLVFMTVCLTYKRNFKYIKGIIGDLTDVRRRNNLFDDTVKESSFLIALNLMCVISGGLLLHTALITHNPELLSLTYQYTILIVMGVTIAYYIFQYVAYWVLGNIFADSAQTSLWIKGFASSQGLLSVILFPLSLMSAFYTENVTIVLIASLICIVLARLIFVCKGFRIFFSQISSWLLFLCYLCSVEIIPAIFAYFAARESCIIMLK